MFRDISFLEKIALKNKIFFHYTLCYVVGWIKL